MASQRALPADEPPADAPPVPVALLDEPLLDEGIGVDEGVLLVPPVLELPLVLVPELPDEAPLLDDGLLVD
jgi:hypothetical protein